MNSLAITILCLWLRLGSAIKMRGVKTEAGSLSTADHNELECDYIKWKSEELFKIDWIVKYPGVETKFLQYWNDGRKLYSIHLYHTVTSYSHYLGKNVPSNGIVDVDSDSVDFKKVGIKVSSDFGGDDLEVCCEVNVMHDNGYGSTSTRKKMSCEHFTVERGQGKKRKENTDRTLL